MLITLEVPESLGNVLQGLSIEELKKRIITANGLTVAREEEILEVEKDEKVTKVWVSDEDVDNYVDSFIK